MTPIETARDGIRANLLELTNLGNYKLGCEGGDWLDEISFNDAFMVGYADLTAQGEQYIRDEASRLMGELGLINCESLIPEHLKSQLTL